MRLDSRADRPNARRRRGPRARGASGEAHAGNPVTNRPAASASRAQALPFDNEHAARGERDPAQLRRRRVFDRRGPDRRHIEPQILSALGRFHQHARRARDAQPPLRAHLGDARAASRRSLRPPRSPAPGPPRRRRPAPRRTPKGRRVGERRARCPFRPPARLRARRADRPARRGAALLRARRRCGFPRARRSRPSRRAAHCPRGETIAQARPPASPRPSRVSGRRIRVSSSRR